MMDCRHALQILDFDDPIADGLPSEVYSADELAAAKAHLESCPACARAVVNRRVLDRSIDQVMRAVQIPRGAQQRLLARISEMESDAAVTGLDESAAPLPAAGVSESAAGMTASSLVPARPSRVTGPVSRRRFLKTFIPIAVCLVVAMTGFFGVVWHFMPRWTVEKVSDALTRIDFPTDTLADFTGNDVAAHLPSVPGWEHLEWPCGRQAKGLPDASNLIAVYAFDIPETRRHNLIRGLIAVIPLSRIRNPPTADSLATATPLHDYLPARIGDSVCVAWQQDKVVYVCLIQGGPDSLATLQGVLEQPSA
jgi:hypothetical protein